MRILIDLQAAQPRSNRVRGIGRYSISFANAIVHAAKQHEVWLIFGAGHPDSIASLRATFVDLVPNERIRTFEVPRPVNELDAKNWWRTRSAELLREKFLSDLRPDLVHVSSICEGATNEIVVSIGEFAPELPTSVLLYDLVPLLNPKSYLQNPMYERSYLRHLQYLKRANLILTISESSRAEAIEALRIPSDRIVNIGAGLSIPGQRQTTVTQEKALLRKNGIDRPFVLYTGGADIRKNIPALIKAFAALPAHLRQNHMLVLAGAVSEQERLELESIGRGEGLNRDELLSLGYVPDEDLVLLYATCAAFVLPSLHEGFGLPILEAMALGAPVLGSNATSIPEIIDRPDALFDPREPKEIATRIARVLTDQDFRNDLKKWGLERVKSFAWENCARRALTAFEMLRTEQREKVHISPARSGPPLVRRRPTMAFVSSLTPETNSIARPKAELLQHLERYYEIHCIIDRPEAVDPWQVATLSVKSPSWFEGQASNMERIIYDVGCATSLQMASRLLPTYPGIVVFHYSHPGQIFNRTRKVETLEPDFSRLLFESHGYPALLMEQVHGREKVLTTYTCIGGFLRDSVGVIVTSPTSIVEAQTWLGENGSSRVRSLEAVEKHKSKTQSTIAAVAQNYWAIIEDLYETSTVAREGELLRAIARISADAEPTKEDLAAVASSISSNRERVGIRKTLFDISTIVGRDPAKEVKAYPWSMLRILLTGSSTEFRVEPVYSAGAIYRYARKWACRLLNLNVRSLTDDVVGTNFGDVLVRISPPNLSAESERWLETQKNRGLVIYSIAAEDFQMLSEAKSVEQLLRLLVKKSL